MTIVERLPQLLIREDQDAADLVSKQLIKEGVEILVNHNVTGFSCNGNTQSVALEFQQQTIFKEFDLVLVAIGRQTNVSGFGLE